jgi:hypothetical protein
MQRKSLNIRKKSAPRFASVLVSKIFKTYWKLIGNLLETYWKLIGNLLETYWKPKSIKKTEIFKYVTINI